MKPLPTPNRLRLPFALTAAAALAVASPLHAVLITEYADYGASDISMQSTVVGTAVAGQWADGWSIGTGSNYGRYESSQNLTYSTTGYTSNTTGGDFERSNNTAVHDREFESALTGTIWLSGLVLGNRSDGRSNPKLTLTGDNAEKTIFGLEDSGTDVAATAYFGQLSFDGTTIDTSATTLYGNTTHLLLVKVTLNYSGDFDRIELWIDPDVSSVAGSGQAGLAAATLTLDGSDGLGDSLTHAGFSLSLPTAAADALRISSTGGDDGLNEVLTGVPVPEPTSLVLLLGSAGFVFLRRRRV